MFANKIFSDKLKGKQEATLKLKRKESDEFFKSCLPIIAQILRLIVLPLKCSIPIK